MSPTSRAAFARESRHLALADSILSELTASDYASRLAQRAAALSASADRLERMSVALLALGRLQEAVDAACAAELDMWAAARLAPSVIASHIASTRSPSASHQTGG